jgi:hypothetical protein
MLFSVVQRSRASALLARFPPVILKSVHGLVGAYEKKSLLFLWSEGCSRGRVYPRWRTPRHPADRGQIFQ